MNSIKNLMIIAVLAAVGYGVYVSLSRNNIEPSQTFTVTKGSLSSAKLSTTPGGPLALGGSSTSPAQPADPIAGKALPLAMPSLAPAPSGNTPPGLTPPGLTPPGAASSNPGASLGMPLPPSGGSTTQVKPDTLGLGVDAQMPSPNAVRNLAPPPGIASDVSPVENTKPPAANPPTNSRLQGDIAKFMEGVQKTLDDGKLAEAQLALSLLYGNPDLPADLAKQITDLLDQLAGTVIYSRQHLLAPAYMTQPGDTIEKIAQKYDVPWQLLARINGLLPPGASMADDAVKDQPLPQGKELKVVQGPFDAVIQLEKHELTLMVQNRYAGRFPIGVGRDQPKLDGEYTVRGKKPSPTYYGNDGVTFAPNDPKNPLGGAWIELTDRIGIHGAADPQAIGHDVDRGTICVADRDLQDLYGILSVGSRVTIVR